MRDRDETPRSDRDERSERDERQRESDRRRERRNRPASYGNRIAIPGCGSIIIRWPC